MLKKRMWIDLKLYFRITPWIDHVIKTVSNHTGPAQFSINDPCLADYTINTTVEKLANPYKRRFRISRRQSSFSTRSVCACEEKCSQNKKCQAFTFKKETIGKNCFLKGLLSKKTKKAKKPNSILFAERKLSWFKSYLARPFLLLLHLLTNAALLYPDIHTFRFLQREK